MKKIKKEIPLYKQRLAKIDWREEPSSGPMILRDTIALPGFGLSIPVRAAKSKLSALLELVSSGQEVTITSDGKPKAVLSPVAKTKARKVFAGMGDYLMKQPIHRGPTADEIIREDRDARGW